MDGGAARGVGGELDDLARCVRRLGRDVRSADAVTWESLAAQRFREYLASEAEALRRSAVLLEEAAESWRRHAVTLDASPWPVSWVG
jgi:hypothetical protein